MIWEAWMWLFIVIVLAVAAPVIADHIRKKDYQDQISGKKKEREWKNKIFYDKPSQPDMKNEELKEEMIRKTKDNSSGLF